MKKGFALCALCAALAASAPALSFEVASSFYLMPLDTGALFAGDARLSDSVMGWDADVTAFWPLSRHLALGLNFGFGIGSSDRLGNSDSYMATELALNAAPALRLNLGKRFSLFVAPGVNLELLGDERYKGYSAFIPKREKICKPGWYKPFYNKWWERSGDDWYKALYFDLNTGVRVWLANLPAVSIGLAAGANIGFPITNFNFDYITARFYAGLVFDIKYTAG